MSRLVSIGTHRLHLHCAGAGSPSVVFEAALGASSLSWSLVQPAVSALTRACAYDRAGFGQSDGGPLPRTAERVARELAALAEHAPVPPPYLLVGHSFGALVVHRFATLRPADVAGLVLLEPAIPEVWASPGDEERAQIARGVRLCRYGAAAARFGVARAVSTLVGLGALGPARAITRLVSRGGLTREDEGILAPIWKLPPEARRILGRVWTRPEFFEALGSQIGSMGDSARGALERWHEGYGDRPVVVMTAAGASTRRLEADAALARQSPRGRHVLVPDSGHWIPLDAPRAVIDVVTAMIEEIRARR